VHVQAIVFRLPDLVQLLLENEANVWLKTHGTFFVPGGKCYYGETPLNFAVSTGQVRVVKLIIDAVRTSPGRDGLARNFMEERQKVFRTISQCDSLGNTAVHMCIVHKQMSLLDFLLDLYPGLNSISEEARTQLGKAEDELWDRFDDGSGYLTVDEFKERMRILYTETALQGTGLNAKVWESFACDSPSKHIPDHRELVSLEVQADRAARDAARRVDKDGDGFIDRAEWKKFFIGEWW